MGIAADSFTTEGLYPAHDETVREGAAILAGKTVPATVHIDTAAQTDSVTVSVRIYQVLQVRQYVQAAEPPHSGMYNLYGRNCARFVEGALNSASIASSGTMYPHDLMTDLHTRYDHQN